MTPPRKLAAFAVVVLAAFGLGWRVGAVADPIVEPERTTIFDHGDHDG